MTPRIKLALSLCCLALLSGAGGPLVATSDSTNVSDEDAIRQTVQLYFDGIIKYDEQALRRAFLPDAAVVGTTAEGTLEWEPFQEWVLYTRGTAPDPAGRNNHILSIDISGRAAVVKTDLDWPSAHYTDYLSLVKADGEWKIAHKTWHRAEPSR